MSELFRLLVLALRLHAAAPALPISAAVAHARLALEHEDGRLDAALLLGVAAIESDFNPRTVSRPPRIRAWGFCSIFQTIATSEAECVAQRDLHVAYRVGVAELGWWLHRCDGDVRCMLCGHGCGPAGVRLGWCGQPIHGLRYPERVLAFARRLRWA